MRQNKYAYSMEAIQIVMPVLTLIAVTVGACLTVMVIAALAGKYFGGFIK